MVEVNLGCRPLCCRRVVAWRLTPGRTARTPPWRATCAEAKIAALTAIRATLAEVVRGRLRQPDRPHLPRLPAALRRSGRRAHHL